jgi:hypothetical protein
VMNDLVVQLREDQKTLQAYYKTLGVFSGSVAYQMYQMELIKGVDMFATAKEIENWSDAFYIYNVFLKAHEANTSTKEIKNINKSGTPKKETDPSPSP